MSEPLVSVIITTYAGSRVLPRAICSVQNQTYTAWELIVVDDNNPGTEERTRTEKVMAQYADNEKIRYIQHERNKNGSAARNTGIRNAKGEYISLLDDDDIYYPERLACCVAKLQEHPECDSVQTGVVVTDGKKVIDNVVQFNHKDPLRDMFFGNALGTGSNLFLSRKAVYDLNGFDESFLRRQDVEFMVRFYQKYKTVYIYNNLVAKIVEKRHGVVINYKKFKNIESHFIDTFHSVINGHLSLEDRKSYLDHTFTVLFRMAIVSSSEDVQEAIEDLMKIRPLNRKEKLLVYIEKPYRWARNNPILYALKERWVQICNYNSSSSWDQVISNEELQFLKSMEAIEG